MSVKAVQKAGWLNCNGRPTRGRNDGGMRNASSTAQQWIGHGKLALSDSWTEYGQPVVSGVQMGYGTDRVGTSISRLTFDSALFLSSAILSSSIGALSVSVISLSGLATVDIVT